MAVSTAVDLSAVARTVGIQVSFKDLRGGRVLFLPQRIGLVGQGNTAATYSLAKLQVFSAQEVGTTFGFGSPLHLAAKQLFPANGDGVGSIPVDVLPLEDDGSAVVAAGDITPTGTMTATKSYIITIGNVSASFTLLDLGTVADATAAITAAINGNVNMPVIATDGTTVVDFDAKWKGESGNSIITSITGDLAGITFAFTQATAGATNPDVDDALALIGAVWETIVINPMEYSDTVTLGKFATFNEGRWLPVASKPFVAFVGSVVTVAATLITAGDLRKTDRTNSLIVVPASTSLPVEIAARTAARVAVQANNNPPVDYPGDQLTGIDAGLASDQFSYSERDSLVKAGISTTRLIDNIIEMDDTVTFYHPDGEEPPAYRYVVDIVKLQNLIFNLNLRFNSSNWEGTVLIPDTTPTVNSEARSPKDAKSEIFSLIDNAALQAWISDPDFAKDSTLAKISSTNPKRLDVALTVKLSGNTNIISVNLNFGFFFG